MAWLEHESERANGRSISVATSEGATILDVKNFLSSPVIFETRSRSGRQRAPIFRLSKSHSEPSTWILPAATSGQLIRFALITQSFIILKIASHFVDLFVFTSRQLPAKREGELEK